jgi:hypothetical protein
MDSKTPIRSWRQQTFNFHGKFHNHEKHRSDPKGPIEEPEPIPFKIEEPEGQLTEPVAESYEWW